jgi:ribonuclease J
VVPKTTRPSDKELRITVYGGAAGDGAAGEIGGNKILLETGERTWFLDFGMGFGKAGYFFDEFLQPRSAVGLRDFLRLGLIPPLEGIYREDLTAHEPDLWERYRTHPSYRRVERLDGVLLSHAHQDHNGYIGFLQRETPLYTGLMTALIGKGMQDLGSGEFSYVSPKEVSDDGALKSVTGVKQGRPHFICETDEVITRALEDLRSFFADHPGARTRFEPAPTETADLEASGIRFFRVDHSIPGSGAFAIDTPIGWVGYTGDLRRHGHSKWRTEGFAQQLRELKPAVLIVEGTRLDDTPAIEEPAVHEAARGVVKRETGLVIADFSARNIERLRTFRDIANELGRRLVVTMKDAYLLQHMHVIDAKIPAPDEEGLMILKTPRASSYGWEKALLDTYSGHVTDARAIRHRPGDFILCLSYWDIASLIDIEPDRGTYIYSASEAYDEEQKFDHLRLTHWLDHFGLTKVGGLPGAEQGPYHASGHIDGPGMQWLIETINPQKILPVHSQKLAWFEQRWPEKVVRGGYGAAVRFD